MIVLITGGKGDVAQAIATRLTSSGHEVFALSRQELDVTQQDSVASAIQQIQPEVLINNAGAVFPAEITAVNWQSLDSGDLETTKWVDQVMVNLIGTYLCSKCALLKGCKQIINIGSSAAAEGKAGWSAYCAAKSGVERLTESLHKEGHHATCIRLGRTRTKMRRGLCGEESPTTLLDPDNVAALVECIVNAPSEYSGKIIPLSKH